MKLNEERHMSFTPAWHSYFWQYLAGIVLIPLLGTGILILWLVHRKRRSLVYQFHDRYIKMIRNGEASRLELQNINEITVRQTRIEKLFNSGTVQLTANVSTIELSGMEKPHELAAMITKARDSEISRRTGPVKTEKRQTTHKPGTLDKMDYLTGLWQQGLISDEEFKRERKHFE